MNPVRPHKQYVFGYGSLVDPGALSEYLGRPQYDPGLYQLCNLSGYRRVWNLARSNLCKSATSYYKDPQSGQRPDLRVVFLNVRPAPGESIAGILFAVDQAELSLLDAREFRYERKDVRRLIDAEVDGPVWLYVGSARAEAEYHEGLAQGDAFIALGYHEFVKQAYAGWGPAQLEAYLKTTDPPRAPLRDLARVNVA